MEINGAGKSSLATKQDSYHHVRPLFLYQQYHFFFKLQLMLCWSIDYIYIYMYIEKGVWHEWEEQVKLAKETAWIQHQKGIIINYISINHPFF